MEIIELVVGPNSVFLPALQRDGECFSASVPMAIQKEIAEGTSWALGRLPEGLVCDAVQSNPGAVPFGEEAPLTSGLEIPTGFTFRPRM